MQRFYLFGQSQEEATFIDQLARDQNPDENEEYWIGLSRNEEGTLGHLNNKSFNLYFLVFEKIDLTSQFISKDQSLRIF